MFLPTLNISLFTSQLLCPIAEAGVEQGMQSGKIVAEQMQANKLDLR